MASSSPNPTSTVKEFFPPVPKDKAVVPVGTGVIDTVMTFFTRGFSATSLGKAPARLVVEYVGNKEIYGEAYVLELATEQAKSLWKQGFYVFAHGQSLSSAAHTESIQRPYAALLDEDVGSVWGERRMLMRLPKAEQGPATVVEYFAAHPKIDDSTEPHQSDLLSVDFQLLNDTYLESARHFFGPENDKAYAKAPNAFAKLGGRYYLFVVDPSVMRDPAQNFAYRCFEYGVPCMDSVGKQAARLMTDCTRAVDQYIYDAAKAEITFPSYQARFVMRGYLAGLMSGKVRAFTYDTLSYGQRQWYQEQLDEMPAFQGYVPPLPRLSLSPAVVEVDEESSPTSTASPVSSPTAIG